MALSRLMVLAGSILVARRLGQESFGALGVITGTVGMFQAFAGCGLGITATKHVSEYRAAATPHRAGAIIRMSLVVAAVLGFVVAAIFFAGSGWIASRTLADPALGRTLRIASPLLLFGTVSGVQTGALAGLEAYKRTAYVNALTGFFSVILSVGGAFVGGVDGATAGATIGGAVNVLAADVALRREARAQGIPIRRSDGISEFAVLWRFSLPATAAGLMVTPVNWACSALLVNTPRGYAEMGILNAANQWFSAVIFLPTVTAQVFLPALSNRLGSRDRHGAGRVFWAGLGGNTAVALPIVLIGSLFSPFIMGMYGSRFSGQWLTFSLTLATAGILALQVSVAHLITASGRMWASLWMNIGWAIVTLTFTALLVPWGALGLAVARLGGYAVHSIWVFWFAWRLYRERFALGEHAAVMSG